MSTLLLFDIDGTLLSGGPAKQAFHIALVDAFGTAGDIEVLDFSGKTDPQIARELLTGAGLSDAEVDARLDQLFARYLRELEARLPDEPVRVLPGVEALLDTLEAAQHRGQAALGLVTGNVVGGARLKLASAGFRQDFAVGGFGSDSEERNDLPAIALERARRHWGRPFATEQSWIIGDTPRDVACAQAHGLRTLAVATGNFSAAELVEAGAELVVEDFSDASAVASELIGL